MESVLERSFPEKKGQTKDGFVEHQNLQFLYQIWLFDTERASSAENDISHIKTLLKVNLFDSYKTHNSTVSFELLNSFQAHIVRVA